MTAEPDLDRRLMAAVDRLDRALRAARQEVATEHGLSLLQLDLLRRLAVTPARVGDLADALDLRQPTVSDAVGSLVAKGLVERTADPGDGRASVLSSTNDGSRRAAQVEAALAPVLASERRMAAEDRGLALEVLLDEIRLLQEHGVISVNRSCLTCRHYRPPAARHPAHCGLLDEPLRRQDLRVDCPDHDAA